MVRTVISKQTNCAGLVIVIRDTASERVEVRFASSARSAPTRAALGRQPCVQYVRAHTYLLSRRRCRKRAKPHQVASKLEEGLSVKDLCEEVGLVEFRVDVLRLHD